VNTRKINEINIDSKEWNQSIYLTFDFDWAADFVINDTLDLLEKYNVSATFFVTHDSPVLTRMRENPKYEIGIHPNFNDLLTCKAMTDLDSKQIISKLMDIAPEAISMRSHSTTNSSRILEIAKNLGIVYDCNYLIPYQANIHIKPWLLWNNMIRAPYFFEDDVSLEYGDNESSMDFLIKKTGLKIFNFHPIHVYLNSDSLELYERSRPHHKEMASLMKYRSQSRGTRDKLLEILEKAKD